MEHIVACGFTDIDARLVLTAWSQETFKENPPSKLPTDQEEHVYHKERGSFEVSTEQPQKTNSENLSRDTLLQTSHLKMLPRTSISTENA
jgi:hypothetical protein